MQHRCSSWQMERYQNLNRFIESSRIYAHLENKNKNKPIKWRNKKEDVTSPPAWPPFALWILGEQRASWPLTSSPAPGVPEGGAAINQFSPSQQVQLWPWSPKFFHLNDTHTHKRTHPNTHTIEHWDQRSTLTTVSPTPPWGWSLLSRQCSTRPAWFVLHLSAVLVFIWSPFGIKQQLQTKVHAVWLSSANEKKKKKKRWKCFQQEDCEFDPRPEVFLREAWMFSQLAGISPGSPVFAGFSPGSPWVTWVLSRFSSFLLLFNIIHVRGIGNSNWPQQNSNTVNPGRSQNQFWVLLEQLDHPMIPGRGAATVHRSFRGSNGSNTETNFTSFGIVTFSGTQTLKWVDGW